VSKVTEHHRLLRLRVLALEAATIPYQPHADWVRVLSETKDTKLGNCEPTINYLAHRYRRQISPELVPHIR